MHHLQQKIDLFMKQYIVPRFQPENIHWVFSVSGGKDSFGLCQGIYDWYSAHGLSLTASAIHIWQWGDIHPKSRLEKALPWLTDIEIVDARFRTSEKLEQRTCLQAHCRECADIRRCYSDMYLEKLSTDKTIILCRGLHLTDMAISILWRHIWYGSGDRLEGKGQPLVKLYDNKYLAKPLCFAREFECQQFAEDHGFVPFICPCPAIKYPSRRDIIEESARHYYTGSLWEFDIPGISQYLSRIMGGDDTEKLIQLSARGRETKNNCIPDSYYTFSKEYFQNNLRKNPDFSKNSIEADCISRLFADDLSDFELRMIGTLGPFYPAFSLPTDERGRVLALQTELWDFTPNIDWSQVMGLLEKYYNM